MFLADWEIKKLLEETKQRRSSKEHQPQDETELFDIEHFEAEFAARRLPNGLYTPSAGLSPHGYDARLSKHFDIEGENHVFTDEVYYLEGGASILASTVERLKLPPTICGWVVGKSTYARQFILCNTTPLEAGWTGHVTLELTNLGREPVPLYIGAGICQLRFNLCAPAEKPYGSRGKNDGKYQRQGHAVAAR